MDNIPKTIGLEIESVIRSRDDIAQFLQFSDSPLKSITRDASVESMIHKVSQNTSLFLGRRSIRDSIKNRVTENPIVSGYEIVTKPLIIEDMRKTISRVISTLVSNGEIYSPRSSIHVHIGYPNGLIFLKTAMSMGLKVEPLLYKIAGMGLPYRGSINHSAYARPLASPPAIKMDEGGYALLDPAGSVESTSYVDFWAKLGIDSRERGRYFPLRYFGINLYSILLRGTLEFRVFNFCQCPGKVEAITSLCQFISDLMLRIPLDRVKELPNISIFEKNPDSYYFDLLGNMLELGDYYNSEFKMSPDDIDNVVDLIGATPQPEFRDEHILTHIQTTMVTQSAKAFGLPTCDKASEPGIIDIHNFGQMNHSLLGAE